MRHLGRWLTPQRARGRQQGQFYCRREKIGRESATEAVGSSKSISVQSSSAHSFSSRGIHERETEEKDSASSQILFRKGWNSPFLIFQFSIHLIDDELGVREDGEISDSLLLGKAEREDHSHVLRDVVGTQGERSCKLRDVRVVLVKEDRCCRRTSRGSSGSIAFRCRYHLSTQP